MDIYKRVLRSVIATVCACSAMAGIGLAVAPGSALATIPCAAITGSGSSLQQAQQTLWTSSVGTTGFLLLVNKKTEECNPGNPKITYTSTSSGKGLAEFGVGTSKLVPTESGNGSSLDAFIGTDDPPTTTQLTEIEKASGSKAVVTPVVVAPIAVIFHLPANCEVTSAAFEISNIVLNELWLGKFANWKTFLTAAVGATNFSEKTSKACETPAVLLEVRSDNSGTSYAFKQYLCQVEGAGGTWQKPANGCEEDKEFINDETKWPATVQKTHGAGIENKGSKGEAEAVEAEEGSVGYVNAADAKAATVKFGPFKAGSKTFWGRVNNASEIEKTGNIANCETTYTFPSMAIEKEAEESKWEKIHLAKPTSTKYPICTFTYDVGWENYLTTELESSKGYGSALKAEETGNTAKGYFEYMVSSTEGQKNIAEFYAPLPTNVDTIAEKLAELLKA